MEVWSRPARETHMQSHVQKQLYLVQTQTKTVFTDVSFKTFCPQCTADQADVTHAHVEALGQVVGPNPNAQVDTIMTHEPRFHLQQ